MTVKTRFSPSPTGFMHIGGLRTALYNYFFAKQQGGSFILRIEDTDQTRYVQGSVESLINTLGRIGIDYDEGPVIQNGQIEEKGAHGSYIQSNRREIYNAHALQLIKTGQAYYCFCSKERLEQIRTLQQAEKKPTKYDRTCRTLDPKEVQHRIETHEPRVIRMFIPEGKTTFQDEVRGSITIDNSEFDDQVLIKSDGYPTYHLAVVVDDHLMEITHVIRGEEWLSSVPKQILLYQWFGFSLPIFAHLPLILNPDKSKLSKRQGDVSVEDFLAKGYLEEALINFVSLLGFNPTADREIYTQQELIQAFDLKKINKSGAVFDVKKLVWMNAQYIRALSGSELALRVRPFLDGGVEIDQTRLERICEVEKTRMSLLSDIRGLLTIYLTQPLYDSKILVWKKSDREDARLQLSLLIPFMTSLSQDCFASTTLLDNALKRYIKERSLQNGNVLWPLRVALSGSERSAGPHELCFVLGQDETIRRIQHAQNLLS